MCFFIYYFLIVWEFFIKVPHKLIAAEQLALAKLNPSQTVLVNCWEEMNVDVMEVR